MSLLFPYTSSGPKQSLSSKFKVASQARLKKVSNTYWRKQFSKKGIKMKGEEGDLVYVKAPGIRSKVSALLRKRGYLTEKTLRRDLVKERVKTIDRVKVIDALRKKFAKRITTSLTPEQIQANVKRARAVSRLMSTKGRSKADDIKKGRSASEIKQRFKEDYSSINVHGQKYSIGISTEKRSADDTRYQSETKEDGKGVSVSINAAGKIKSLTGDSKSISSSGEKENPIATAIGAKQPTPTKEKSGKIAEKIAGGGSGGAFTISPMPRGVLAKKKLEKEDENSESRWHRPIFDSEFQGGIIYRDKKLMHFPDLSNNFISPGETKSPAKENQDKEASTAGSDTSFQEVYDKKKIIILFFGPPGSGKGTQSDLLGKSLNLPIISPGELLRHEEEAGTEIGQAVAKQMAQGQLVPSEIIEQILDLRLSQPDAVLGFILDGYPRSVEQLDFFRQRMARLLTPGDKIIAIYIAVSDKEVESRVSSRRVCDCGAAYHLKYNPPKVAGKCDLCGRELKLREDDKPEVIARRLNDFRQTVRPIIEYFKNSYIYLEVNGEQEISKIKEEIYQRISPIINDNG